MVYITVKQSPMFHQMTLEELLFQDYKGPAIVNTSDSNTMTYEFDRASEHFISRIDVSSLIAKLTRYKAISKLYASWAFLPRSAFSTAFQRVARSWYWLGAWGGRRMSVQTTPPLWV